MAEGLVTQDQADRIRARYERREEGPGWGMLVFSGLGSAIIGLGVILMLAYNWQAIPRLVKLALILASVAGAHAAGLWLFFRSARFRALGEALTVLGTMLFGAGIWLVAQIYHIHEHYPNGIVLWAGGALALAWFLPSVVQGALAAVLLTVWCGTEAFGFDASMHAAPGLLFVAVGALAWRGKSRFLLAATLPCVILTLIFAMLGGHGRAENVVVNTVMNVAVALVGAGILARRSRRFPESAPILAFFGWLVALPLLYALTFGHVARHSLDLSPADLGVPLWCYWIGSLVCCLGVWAWIGFRSIARTPGWTVPLDHFLLPLTVIVWVLALTLTRGLDKEWLVLPFHVVLLALIVGMMTRGCRHALPAPTVIGSLLLVAYMFARYFDLFENLFVRGAIFLVVGGAIFAQGLIYNRTKRRQAAREKPA